MVADVVDGGLKLEAVLTKFLDLICDVMNIEFILEVDGLFLLALLDFDFLVDCLLGPGRSCLSLWRRCRFRLAGSRGFFGRHDERGDRMMSSSGNDRQRWCWGRNERYKEKLAKVSKMMKISLSGEIRIIRRETAT